MFCIVNVCSFLYFKISKYIKKYGYQIHFKVRIKLKNVSVMNGNFIKFGNRIAQQSKTGQYTVLSTMANWPL